MNSRTLAIAIKASMEQSELLEGQGKPNEALDAEIAACRMELVRLGMGSQRRMAGHTKGT